MTEQEMVDKALEMGWTVDPVSLFDEEGVEGWCWTSPEGWETMLVGNWDETPELPISLYLELTRNG